jgi:hypothetical protein
MVPISGLETKPGLEIKVGTIIMYRYNESFVFCSLAAFMQVNYRSTEFASDFRGLF